MVHNELHALDLAIIGAYLIAMVLIGLVVVKKVRSMDDYYLGGRSFGPLVLMATVCATIIGGSGLMGRAGVAYSSGFKAIMTALPYLLGMFIFSGLAGRISDVGTKFGVTSIPDLFEQRFGKNGQGRAGLPHCVHHDGHGRLAGHGDSHDHQYARRRDRHFL